ncbi:MAG: PDZ domain-containing protein [Planctomycetota bacterium]
MRFWHIATLAVLSVLTATPACAQPASHAELGNRAVEAFNSGDYDEAERLWKRWAELDETTFVPWYNLACARSMRGDGEGAAEHLITAIERGFSDFSRIESDPNLRAFRATDTFEQLQTAWPAFLDRRIDTQLEAARRVYGPRYSYIKDEKHRLGFVSAYDTVTSRQAREEVRLVADWTIRNLFPELGSPSSDHPDPWVMVILPTREHFAGWARQTYGDMPASATSQLGGAYSHDDKKLVTVDLGSTLRHEFLHVLHFRSADRLGQSHPIWIQEGLAAIVEDMGPTSRGPFDPVPSWRTNSIKRLAQQNKLPGISDFATMPRDRFSGNRPLANYAFARAVFMYLHERGQLGEWYSTYTQTHDLDPTGRKALIAVTGRTLNEFDDDIRRWARDLPEVYEQNRPPLLGIGARLDLEHGDGPIVRKLIHDNATRAGLRPGDIITGLDGTPVRDLNEFYRVLTGLEAGQRVRVDYRRRLEHRRTTVVLVEAR